MYYQIRSLRHVLFLSVALLSAIASQAAEPTGIEVPAITVTLAGKEYHLLFEIKDLPVELKTAIATDIEGVFQDCNEMTIREYGDNSEGFSVKKYHLSASAP